MSICNFCSLNRIKKDAKLKGLIVEKTRATFGLGGFDIWVTPKDIKKSYLKSLREGDKDFTKYYKAWMKEIPSTCYCD